MANARRKGAQIGRSSVLVSRGGGFERRWLEIRALLLEASIGKREAARQLGIGAGTLQGWLTLEREYRDHLAH